MDQGGGGEGIDRDAVRQDGNRIGGEVGRDEFLAVGGAKREPMDPAAGRVHDLRSEIGIGGAGTITQGLPASRSIVLGKIMHLV